MCVYGVRERETYKERRERNKITYLQSLSYILLIAVVVVVEFTDRLN